MRAICVEDEVLLLEMTVTMCQELQRFDEVKGFLRAREALTWLEEHPADVALLDINIPDMDGITLAARIKELHPNMAIIFLTGYDQYAADAFALHAAGYILKPIVRDRLAAEVDYALSLRRALAAPSARVKVETFGDFRVFADGTEVHFRRSKARELLAYLIDNQGKSVTRAQAIAALWEDREYTRAMQKQMDVVVRSLRSTLREYGISEIFELREGQMRIRPELMDCDMYRFLDGDAEAIRAYRGEYMSAYSWAEMLGGYLTRKKNDG